MVKQSRQLPQYKATGLGAMISALGVHTPQDTLFVAVQAISGTGTQLNAQSAYMLAFGFYPLSSIACRLVAFGQRS